MNVKSSETREMLEKNPEVLRIFNEHATDIHIRVDRAMSGLMALQWLFAVLTAWLVSPHTWIGQFDQVNESIIMAVVLGGLLAIPPIYLAKAYPGRFLTRTMMAVSQVCFSTLFVHLSGGRIETHFHIFVSLAFLAFYKDARVLLLASAIVIVDHMFRGVFMPMSIYGEMGGFRWRWIEYAGWVLFEDAVLIWGLSRIRLDLVDMAIARYQLDRARKEAIQASALKSSFLSNMSHEIRTPLNSIIGFSDILVDTRLDDEQKQFVGTINSCSSSLLHLLNDILDFSKIENGLLELDIHEFDVRKLHEEINQLHQLQCKEKELELIFEISPDIPEMITADSHRLRQILINLISNAIKFTEQGQIVVRLEKEGRFYKWSVTDSGMGISAENIEKIFNVFTQASSSVSRKFGGVGLGLAIAKNLVELMGGKISVRSSTIEGQDRGTTFTFTLPQQNRPGVKLEEIKLK